MEFTISLTHLEYVVLHDIRGVHVSAPIDGKYHVSAYDDLFESVDSDEDYFEQVAEAVRFVERNWERINDFAVLEEGSIEEFLYPVTQRFCLKEYLPDLLYDTGMGDHNVLMRILGNEVVRRCLINIYTRKACYEKEE